jgi:hypothetical protein
MTISVSGRRIAPPAGASAVFTCLRGNHLGSTSLSGHTIEGGDPASRQEGATAEKAVPFSNLRFSIAIEQSGERNDDVDLPVRGRGDDFLLPLYSGGRDERRG